VAVAKLLGWMQGPIRRKYIEVTLDGIPEKEMPFLHTLEVPLKNLLMEMREVAQSKLAEAFDVDDQQGTNESRIALSDADDNVEKINQKIYLAAEYFCAIDDELARGVDSELRIDRSANDDPSNPQITLKSLDAWAKGRGYPLQIMGVYHEHAGQHEQAKDEIEEPLLNAKGGMTPTMAKSFLVTFAIVLEEFVKKMGTQFKSESGTGMNMEEIAKYLSKLSLPGARSGHFLKSQSISSIEARMKEVLNASSDAILVQREKELKIRK
jgi:hypothetical protein